MNRRDAPKAGGLAVLTGLTPGRVAADDPPSKKVGHELLLSVNKQGDTVSFFDPSDRHRILAEVKLPAHPHEVMIDTIDALDAWWSPTFIPERLGRT